MGSLWEGLHPQNRGIFVGKEIDISIVGFTASGKSSVAHAIKNALLPFGVEVVEITGCEDEPPGVMEAEWDTRLREAAKDMRVYIRTHQRVRNPHKTNNEEDENERRP